MYAMIFSPVVGVNHHEQTILLESGLLSDDTIESFVWLFMKFLEAMPDHKPLGVIITDQDTAILKVMDMVLPSTFHRYCLWHILNKFSQKVNAVLYNEQYHILVNIIKQSEMSEEFEHRWAEIMEITDLNTRMKDIDDGGFVAMSKPRSKSPDNIPTACDPNSIRAKRCWKRLKLSREKALTRDTRQYRVCGVAGHDKRTCPKLRERSTMLGADFQENDYGPKYEGEDAKENYRLDETYTSIVSSNFEREHGSFNYGGYKNLGD